MSPLLERREFIKSLAAAAVAVNAPLPVGFPKPQTEWWTAGHLCTNIDSWKHFHIVFEVMSSAHSDGTYTARMVGVGESNMEEVEKDVALAT